MWRCQLYVTFVCLPPVWVWSHSMEATSCSTRPVWQNPPYCPGSVSPLTSPRKSLVPRPANMGGRPECVALRCWICTLRILSSVARLLLFA
ncbi:hypothetical protein F4780DRAFT_730953 [Xylariomycetidae sp. FL0641]|nr:hypothetical protein F4780DRAFT_730953 [Xylariomycetidae sp. FL0641]